MFWILCFSNPFTKGQRKMRNPTWGDEFMMGKWTINSFDLTNNETSTNYSMILMPHMHEDALIGNISWTVDEESYFYELSLRFSGLNRDRFTAFYIQDGHEKLLANVQFTYGDDFRLVSYGKIVNTNITYSINMFTEKSMEITTFDTETNDFMLYRLSKPDLRPPPNPIKKYFYAIMVIAYIYFRNKDQQEREAAQAGNTKNQQNNTSNNQNNQNKGSNKGKQKKRK